MDAIKKYIPNSDVKLEKYLNEALEDKEFKAFVEKLNISNENAMTNLTSLEESMGEFNNCLNCKNIHECKNRCQGYYLFLENNKTMDFCYRKCKYKKKIDAKEEMPKNIKLFNTSKSILNATMKDIIADANRVDVLKWFQKFIKTYEKGKTRKGLYLYGGFGVGKSYLIAALFNEMAKQDVKSSIVFWPEFLRDLKESFNTDYDEKLEYIKNVDLLLIDDIGAENVTAWSRDEILCTILQHRMDNSLPLFITSNLDLKGLEEHYTNTKNDTDSVKAMRIMERIKYLSEEIKLKGDNLRK